MLYEYSLCSMNKIYTLLNITKIITTMLWNLLPSVSCMRYCILLAIIKSYLNRTCPGAMSLVKIKGATGCFLGYKTYRASWSS